MTADSDLDATFAALANPTRRAILARLASGPANVNDLAQPFEMSLPAISQHIRVLEKAGLIERQKNAHFRPALLTPPPSRKSPTGPSNIAISGARVSTRSTLPLQHEGPNE